MFPATVTRRYSTPGLIQHVGPPSEQTGENSTRETSFERPETDSRRGYGGHRHLEYHRDKRVCDVHMLHHHQAGSPTTLSLLHDLEDSPGMVEAPVFTFWLEQRS